MVTSRRKGLGLLSFGVASKWPLLLAICSSYEVPGCERYHKYCTIWPTMYLQQSTCTSLLAMVCCQWKCSSIEIVITLSCMRYHMKAYKISRLRVKTVCKISSKIFSMILTFYCKPSQAFRTLQHQSFSCRLQVKHSQCRS